MKYLKSACEKFEFVHKQSHEFPNNLGLWKKTLEASILRLVTVEQVDAWVIGLFINGFMMIQNMRNFM